MSRDYSKSEFSKHRAALREFESVCDKVEDLQQENEFLYNDREQVANERDVAVNQFNRTVKEIRDLNSKTRYFGRYSKSSRTMYADNMYGEDDNERKCNNIIKDKISDIAFKILYIIVVISVILLASGVTLSVGVEQWIELVCDPWRILLVVVALFGSYKLLFKRK